MAVTQVAVNAGAMSRSFASTLVLAGVVSVLVMPTLGLALGSQKDKVPANEALGVVQGPAPHPHDGRAGRIEAAATRHGLTPLEAQHLAERVAQIEAERARWRQSVREQIQAQVRVQHDAAAHRQRLAQREAARQEAGRRRGLGRARALGRGLRDRLRRPRPRSQRPDRPRSRQRR